MAVTTNIDIVVRAFDQASQVLTGVQTKVQTLEMTAAKMQRAGVGMMVAGTAMLYPFVKGLNVYSEFENELRNVVAISQDFADASVGVEKFGKIFVDVASQTKFAAAEVAEAGYAFVSRGFDFSDVESGLLPATQFAQAIKGNLIPSTELLLNTLQQYRLEMTDVGNVTDMLSVSIADSALNMERLADSMKYVGPIAYAANESLSDTLASLMLLANAGIYGEQAGTVFRRMMQSILAPTREAEKALQAIGFTTKSLSTGVNDMGDVLEKFKNRFIELGWATLDPVTNEFRILAQHVEDVGKVGREVFQIRATGGFIAMLTQGNELWEEYKHNVETAANATDKMAEVQMASLANMVTILKDKVQALAIEIMSSNETSLKNFVQNLQDIVDWFRQLDPQIQNMITNFVVWSGIALIAAGAINLIVGTFIKFSIYAKGLVTAIRGVTLAMKTMSAVSMVSFAPVLAVIAAIGGVLAILFATMRKADSSKVQESAESASYYLKELGIEADTTSAKMEETYRKMGLMSDPGFDLENYDISASFNEIAEGMNKVGDKTESYYAVNAGNIVKLTNVSLEELEFMLSETQNAFAATRVYTDRETAAWAAAINENMGGAFDSTSARVNQFREQVAALLGLDTYEIYVNVDATELENALAMANELQAALNPETEAMNEMIEKFGEVADESGRTVSQIRASFATIDDIVKDKVEGPSILDNIYTTSGIEAAIAMSAAAMEQVLSESNKINEKILETTGYQLDLRAVQASLAGSMTVLQDKGYSLVDAFDASSNVLQSVFVPRTQEAMRMLETFGLGAEDVANSTNLLSDIYENLFRRKLTVEELKEIFGTEQAIKEFVELMSVIDSAEKAAISYYDVLADSSGYLAMIENMKQSVKIFGGVRDQMVDEISFTGETVEQYMARTLSDALANAMTDAAGFYEMPTGSLISLLEVTVDPEVDFDFENVTKQLDEYRKDRRAGIAAKEFSLDIDNQIRNALDDLGITDIEFATFVELVLQPFVADFDYVAYEDVINKVLNKIPAFTKDIDIEIQLQIANEDTFMSQTEAIMKSIDMEVVKQLGLRENEAVGLVNLYLAEGFSDAFNTALLRARISFDQFLNMLGGLELKMQIDTKPIEEAQEQLNKLDDPMYRPELKPIILDYENSIVPQKITQLITPDISRLQATMKQLSEDENNIIQLSPEFINFEIPAIPEQEMVVDVGFTFDTELLERTMASYSGDEYKTIVLNPEFVDFEIPAIPEQEMVVDVGFALNTELFERALAHYSADLQKNVNLVEPIEESLAKLKTPDAIYAMQQQNYAMNVPVRDASTKLYLDSINLNENYTTNADYETMARQLTREIRVAKSRSMGLG